MTSKKVVKLSGIDTNSNIVNDDIDKIVDMILDGCSEVNFSSSSAKYLGDEMTETGERIPNPRYNATLQKCQTHKHNVSHVCDNTHTRKYMISLDDDYPATSCGTHTHFLKNKRNDMPRQSKVLLWSYLSPRFFRNYCRSFVLFICQNKHARDS